MLNSFWENIGLRFSEKIWQYLFGPAFLFWIGSMLVLISHFGWKASWDLIQSLEIYQELIILLLVLMLLLGSSIIMEAMRPIFLRLFEGYWIWPFNSLADVLSHYQRRRIDRFQYQWNDLKRREENNSLSRLETDRLVQLERILHYTPVDPNDIQPTSLGNVLRVAESTPRIKYGLDAIVCWPRLWMLLPAHAQEELNASRSRMDQLVEMGAWGIIFLVWSWWIPLAGLFGLAWVAFVYTLLLRSATIYADLFETTFDLFRWELYKSMHWPLPTQAGEKEVFAGNQLTEFLWRGTHAQKLVYKKKSEASHE